MDQRLTKYLQDLKDGNQEPDMANQPDTANVPEVAERVNPWAALASGIGQAYAGQPVNLSWVDNVNKF